MNVNDNFFDSLVTKSNGKINSNNLNKIKSGDINGFLKSLPENDAKKINQVLNDDKKMKEILSGETAKKLLELLGGNK